MNHLRSFLFFICTLLSHSAFSQWTQCNGPYGAYISGVASTGNRVLACSKTGQVFLSTDSGTTWSMNYKVPDINYGYTYSIYAKDNKAIFLDYQSLYLSLDSGLSWTLNSQLSIMSLSYAHITDTAIFVIGGQKIYRTFDLGNTWDSLDSDLQSVVINKIQSYGDTLYASFLDGQFIGVAVSFDYGDHWDTYTSQINGPVINGIVADSFGVVLAGMFGMVKFNLSDSSFSPLMQPCNCWNQGITKIDSDYYFLESWRLNRTSDLINKQIVDSGFLTLSDIIPVKSGNRLVGASSIEGIYTSDNSASYWQLSNDGMNTAHISNIVDIDTAILISSPNSGIHSTSSNGNSWLETDSGVARSIYLSIANHDSVFIAVTTNYIYKSTDNGRIWNQIYTTNGIMPRGIYFYNNRFFINWGNGIFMSDDDGVTWRTFYLPIGIGSPYAVVFHADSIFLQFIYYDSLLAKNVDSLSWGKIAFPSGLYFIGQSDSAWFAYTPNGLAKSSDFGSNWNVVISNPSSGIRPFFKGNQIVFASDSSIYYSSDYGNSFTLSDGPRLNTQVTSVLLKDSTLYVGTYDLGIWKTDLTLINSIPSQQEVISQIYPNPTSGLINVTLDHSQERVVVKNITGQICPSGIVSQGANLTTMDLSQNPAGMYFLTVEGGLNSRVYRVVLTK